MCTGDMANTCLCSLTFNFSLCVGGGHMDSAGAHACA